MNKKKILGSFAVLVIAAIAAFNLNLNPQEEGLSDILLSNVEALANENDDSDSSCKWKTTIECGGGFALCSCDGYGFNCRCGDSKWYPN